jgi:ribonucleoside-diphosphate reductase alpha chain
MNTLNRTDLVHVLDKPEVMNTGTEAWDEPVKQPELSSVRVVASTAVSQVQQQR